MAKFISSVFVLVTVITVCSGSAIPMWEFLGRTEKVGIFKSKLMKGKEKSFFCFISLST